MLPFDAGASAWPPPRAAELLDRAVSYTRGVLATVPGTDLSAATPCAAWSLRDLLVHMDDTLAAMAEASRAPVLSLVPPRRPTDDGALLASIRQRACSLVAQWLPPDASAVRLGDTSLDREVVGSVGALEIVLHGWDVAHACASALPIPPALARDLLPVAWAHITPGDRPARFGPALAVADGSSPQAVLLAHAGRS